MISTIVVGLVCDHITSRLSVTLIRAITATLFVVYLVALRDIGCGLPA
jgi:hypothetical protein